MVLFERYFAVRGARRSVTESPSLIEGAHGIDIVELPIRFTDSIAGKTGVEHGDAPRSWTAKIAEGKNQHTPERPNFIPHAVPHRNTLDNPRIDKGINVMQDRENRPSQKQSASYVPHHFSHVITVEPLTFQNR
jgi:hypothetical protein